jgi:deoxyadenosine/deoxycytidine kinase
MPPKLILIEGNIASGKSTIVTALKNLKGFGKIQCILEPLDAWQNIKDSSNENILDKFYKDMQRYCYTFQSYAFLTRVALFDDIDYTADYVFMERSVFTDRDVFAKNCYKQGIMPELEWKIYNDWFSWMINKTFPKLDVTVLYLRCEPFICKQRLDGRARSEEQSVSLQYLTQIHYRHDEWLLNEENAIIIDCSKDVKSIMDNITANLPTPDNVNDSLVDLVGIAC